MKKYLLGLCVSILLPMTTARAEDSYLRDEINQIKDDIVVIQRQLYRDKNDTTAPQESVSNFQIRLGEYDQMIRDMNGKVENIEYRLNTLEKKLETVEKDIDLRFTQMSRQQGTTATKVSTPSVAQVSAAKTATTASSQALYESGLTELKNNNLTQAETKFSQFLTTYPNDTLAGNAQYWLGEVYYKQQNFTKAAIAFKDGYSKYPEGTKGPDCLLKLGLSMKALGKNTEACTAFTNLPSAFKTVSADISSRAKKEAEALACK